MNYKTHTIFFVLIMVVLYTNPKFMMELTSSGLGKALLLIAVVYVGQTFDNKAAFLIAIIVILLLQNVKEGLEVMGSSLETLETKQTDDISEIAKNILNKASEEITKDRETAMNGGKNTGGDLISNDLTRNQINTRGSDDLLANVAVAENNNNNDLEPSGNVPKTVEGFASIM